MPGKPPRGLFCPAHPAARLVVFSSRRPAPGVKIKYRKCSVCGCEFRMKTKEIVVATRPRKPSKPPVAG